jgi:hypothetical protein
MEFTLFYKGDLLKTKKAGAEKKQELRRHFHSQLKLLWQQPPLLGSAGDVPLWNKEISLVYNIGGFRFVPLVNRRIHMIAEIDITLLRPESPGSILKSGDIDNRLKTLLDALKMPGEPNAIPTGDNPLEGEDPFFCLVEDDSLITRISVNTAQLLQSPIYSSEVVLLIHVKTKLTEVIWANIGLG